MSPMVIVHADETADLKTTLHLLGACATWAMSKVSPPCSADLKHVQEVQLPNYGHLKDLRSSFAEVSGSSHKVLRR